MKILAVIQARLNSSRLPRKALADLAGKPMIQHVIDRVSSIKGIAGVVLAVPASDAKEFKEVIDGPILHCDPALAEDDVLGRFASVAALYPAEAFLRITGDCPLICPDVAEQVIQRFLEERADFATNDTTQTGWPDGTDVEVIGKRLLLMAHQTIDRAHDREHVTYGMQFIAGMRQTLLRAPHDYSMHKWSVDTTHDLETVRAILAQKPKDFTFAETIKAAEKATRKIA